MCFDEMMDAGNIISCGALALSVIGAIGAIMQWRKATHVRRAGFIKSLYDEFGRNEILRHGIYMLDYDQEWYDESFHNLEDEETKTKQDIIDSTLSYYHTFVI